MKKEAEERKLHRMPKVHNFLEMWQGSQNLCATQRESRAQDKQMTAVGYISDTEDWLNWNGDLDNPNDSEDDYVADIESDIEQDNSIEDPECPEQRDVSAASNVPGLIRPTRKSKRQAEHVLMTVNAIETRRNQGVKKK